MPYRTLGELRQELQDRTGFGSAGSAANVNRGLLNSFLRDAQWQLYWQAEWPTLTHNADFQMAAGAANVPYDPGWNMDRILWLAANIGSDGAPNWVPMHEGIKLVQYNTYTITPGCPVRYERRVNGFEVLPARDRIYTAKLKYMEPLTRFSQDADVAMIDDGIIFLMALANAKAHYRQKDADQYASQLTAVLARLKSTQWGNKRYLPDYRQQSDPLPRPVVIEP